MIVDETDDRVTGEELVILALVGLGMWAFFGALVYSAWLMLA